MSNHWKVWPIKEELKALVGREVELCRGIAAEALLVGKLIDHGGGTYGVKREAAHGVGRPGLEITFELQEVCGSGIPEADDPYGLVILVKEGTKVYTDTELEDQANALLGFKVTVYDLTSETEREGALYKDADDMYIVRNEGGQAITFMPHNLVRVIANRTIIIN
jgi:hypothetical protein